MDFLTQAWQLHSEITEIFRALHRQPEPSHCEFKTNELIRRALTARSISFLAPANNITIAVITGDMPGKTVGLRCDTDALQLEELTDLPYRSEVPGMMHACGHDAHIAAGLCAAFLLTEHRAALRGTVKIIFQPAEEGEKGAQEVIATGLVDDVDAFFAIHVSPDYPTGTLLCSPGPICASADMFKLTITGKGGHGAYPHLCVDAIAAGAAVVQSLQHVASRFVDPLQPVVLTVGTFHAGTRCNIMAQDAVMEGTIRTFDMQVHRSLVHHAERIIHDVAAAHGCTSTFSHDVICSVTRNDERLAQLALASARKFAPDGPFLPQKMTMMGDDFAEYSSIAPCCYAQIGVGNEAKGMTYAQHHGLFAVDEDALPVMAAWLSQFAMDVLAEE